MRKHQRWTWAERHLLLGVVDLLWRNRNPMFNINSSSMVDGFWFMEYP